MRSIAIVTPLALLAILLTGCSHPVPVPVIDFEFQGTGGRPVYRSTTLSSTLQRDVGAAIEPVVVLLETPSFDDDRYRHQLAIVESLHGEALQLVVVDACTCGIDPSGYSTTPETAQRIAGGTAYFRITLLDGHGVILRRSDTVLSPWDIEDVARGNRAAAH
jgi:hypothetical protein